MTLYRYFPRALAALFLVAVPLSSSCAQQPTDVSRNAIFEDAVAPKVAPRGYDLTIVEFSDYNCPYCKRMHPVLKALLASDPKIRLVYRDWRIFGGASVEAARAAIASQWQGKHAAFNDALHSTGGRLDSASIRAAADRAGVNWPRLQSDLKTHKNEIDALLARTNRQAAAIGLSGTPGLIIGNYLVPGALDLIALRTAVARVRADVSKVK